MEIKVLKNILDANDQMALQNRKLLASKKIMMVNVWASPGAGKTTTMLRTAEALKEKARMAVIEGDVASSIDTVKLTESGVTAIQINTDGGCHLDAGMVNMALQNLPLDELDVIFIENVGNLICPGEFDLGEYKRIIISSTPEGEDKPHKYPLMFTIADACIVNKIDLIPYVNFDIDNFTRTVRGMNGSIEIFTISSINGNGVDKWADWVLKQLDNYRK
ncbi:MAG: hydrogenase nickel incorporation protein HypB [Dehalococcoidales bacterium]|jgi:hydrogenase nickel incorporation protein HypB|nr:hydrogenase nickel incorporation protein HypB [Dehalococcoidales bacterium]